LLQVRARLRIRRLDNCDNIMRPYTSALDQGIGLFNESEYFDAHEAWEGLWFRAQDAQEKRFLQGLIMSAGAFLHTQKQQCAGAAKLLARSIPLLRDGVDAHPDLQLADFIAALERLGSRDDWCTTTAGAAQALPKIGRS
jgi:predicted metal-dependent hydrolase